MLQNFVDVIGGSAQAFHEMIVLCAIQAAIGWRLRASLLEPSIDLWHMPWRAFEASAQEPLGTSLSIQADGICLRANFAICDMMNGPLPKKVLANHWSYLEQPLIVYELLVRPIPGHAPDASSRLKLFLAVS